MRVSRRLPVALLLISLAVALPGAVFHKYIWMYASRKLNPNPSAVHLLQGPVALTNPEVMLAEANRLAWLFNWPKAEPLYAAGRGTLQREGRHKE